ncbi:hypothetical protein WMY93_030377 [Mugilogobius chulae]|uniref:Protein FAM107B n=1 Tax=Mugilogobius chulae TaxID=88201 RepID=A0AAW0MHS3_9GOBI
MEGGNAKKKVAYGNNNKDACQPALTRQSTVDSDEITQPNKLNGSVADFQNCTESFCLAINGLLFGVKPELKRVMEQRRGKLHKEEEQARLGPSDLETELRKRQQKLKEYELEELKQRENQEKVPEFVRVKDNLRRTQMSNQ